MFTGCNEKPETSVGASGKNLTDEIGKINEEESTSATEAVTEVPTEAKEDKSVIKDVLDKKDPMNYLTYLDKSIADALENFYNLNLDVEGPKLPGSSARCIYASPEKGVWFEYILDELETKDNINYEQKSIKSIYIDDPNIIKEVLSESISSPEEDNIYYASVDGVSYKIYCEKYEYADGIYSWISISRSSNDPKNEPITPQTPTDPPATSSNMYGIYVTGNTDLAVMAGNTLIDKKEFGYSGMTYGDELTNGTTYSDGSYQTYSDISVAVNENPSKPMTGTIIVSATRTNTATGNSYPLTVTVDWKATDYGDYMNFTWLSEDING
jgi:hypothetical protein